MMSLFSPFDIYFFLAGKMILIFLFFFNSFSIFYKEGFLSGVLQYSSSFLLKFFNSLTEYNSTKNLTIFSFFLFVFISYLNFLSIFSYCFPVTSQISVVLFLSMSFWVALQILSFTFNFKGQFSHFIPQSSPLILSFFLFLIELISFSIRPLTLMIRLVANILAGHVLVILLNKLVMAFSAGFPLLSILNGVEIFVSMIQSYIFVTLSVLYYSECCDY